MPYVPLRRGAGRLFDENLNRMLRELFDGMGSKNEENSTVVALAADETFIGEWVADENPQVGFNLLTDADGFLYLEMSADGGTTITASIPYEITANEARFDALVKLPGRAFRLRYVNGPAPQTAFVMLAATGIGIYPYKVNSRNVPRFVAFSAQSVSAGSYAILVDLSDKATFPHRDTGSVDLYASFIFVDKTSNSTGQVQLGVITRVDGTSADISYVQGISFNSSSDRQIIRDRVLKSAIQLGQSGGELTKVATQFRATSITAVNTATPLPTPYGTTTPAVGDLIIRFDYISGGAFNAAVSAQYAGNVSTA